MSDDAITVVKDVDTWKTASPRQDQALIEPSVEPPADRDFEERYRLGHVLGEGGMGVVRLGHDLRIGRQVAVKVIQEELTHQAGVRARFFREARVQGQLEHPSIVPVYDIGVAGSTAYFTMKRVKGLTLEQVLAGVLAGDPEMIARYSQRRLLTAFSSVCLAVAYAHSRGVVHRDLKPANVMLGDYGEVIVLDWGLAKLPSVEERVAERVVLPATDEPGTKAGSVLGSPGYMPPEQIRAAASVDVKADIYALGAILFELITLQPMHNGGTVDEIFSSTLLGSAGRPSARAPERKIPEELDELCLGATALNPAERPEARELHERIERFLDGSRGDEQRRDLADMHATQAELALAKSTLAGDAEAASAMRSRALREVSAALALRPNHRGALVTLVSLLSDPPPHLPPEVRAEMERLRKQDRSHSAKNAVLGYAAWFLALPCLLWDGVKSWPALATLGAAMLAATGWTVLLSQLRRVERWQGWVGLVLTFFAIAATSVLLGPFILVPAVCVMVVLIYQVVWRTERHARWVVLVLGLLAVLGPALLQLTGLLPRTYTVDERGLLVIPWAVHLGSVTVWVGFVVFHVGVLVTASQLASRSVDVFVAAERSLFLHAWQLRQLIPDGARDGERRARKDS
ncbi:MAG: protein kinase [Polyangiaceae bacterium]|nr:protein kinase [Polyangiaceae bacterium]MCW5790946.1 protein kinase [Polyangiaceae bacterium]